jgi:hypothetical protein
LNTIKRDLDEGFEQINKIIDLIKAIEEGLVSYTGIVTTSPVIKASTMLALYNIIESTITKVLKKIHLDIISSNSSFEDLTQEIKNLIILYYFYHKKNANNIHDSLDVINDTINIIGCKKMFNLTYDDMSKVYQLYSGNLDAKEVRSIFKKYGVMLNEDVGQSLHTIKKVRNKLAHGEQSFEDYGRTLVRTKLEEFFQDTQSFLNMVLNIVSDFISQKKYRTKKTKNMNKRHKKNKR